MKSLKFHFESLLDDDDDFYGAIDKKMVESWIRDNYRIYGNLSISDDLIVDCGGRVIVKNGHITSLTNGLFHWGKVGGIFACSNCRNLTSLEGAPKVVGDNFSCHHCDNLKSLKGSPEITRGGFLCHQCKSLIDLNGAPKRVFGGFNCDKCENLKSLKGAPKEVGGSFWCDHCGKLETLEGAPEWVGGSFYCEGCPNLKISASDRKKYKIENWNEIIGHMS